MKNYKPWIFATIALLIVLNGIMLVILLRHQRGNRPPDMRGDAKAYLTKILDLDSKQAAEYDALVKQHFNFTRYLNEQNRQLRDSLFAGLKNPDTKPMKTTFIAAQIATNQMRIDTATYFHFKKLRSLLTDAQKQKFDGVIQKVLHMMAGPHPPGRPGNDPGHEGPPMGPPPGDGPPPEN